MSFQPERAPIQCNTCSCLTMAMSFISKHSIPVSVFAKSDAVILSALTSKRSRELGCTQSQYLCRGSLPLAAVAWSRFALGALFTVAGTPATTEWTLDPETDGFSSPTAFFIMLPTFVAQGQGRGWNQLFVCTRSLRSSLWMSLSQRQWLSSVFSQLFNSSPFPLSEINVVWADSWWTFIWFNMWGVQRCKFPVHASKLFVFDIFTCPAWQTVSSMREKTIAALLYRSNPFALVTMGQRLSVPMVTIKTRLRRKPHSVKLYFYLFFL